MDPPRIGARALAAASGSDPPRRLRSPWLLTEGGPERDHRHQTPALSLARAVSTATSAPGPCSVGVAGPPGPSNAKEAAQAARAGIGSVALAVVPLPGALS